MVCLYIHIHTHLLLLLSWLSLFIIIIIIILYCIHNMYIPCMDPLGHSHSLGMSTLLGKKYTGVRFDQYPTYPTSFSLKRPYYKHIYPPTSWRLCSLESSRNLGLPSSQPGSGSHVSWWKHVINRKNLGKSIIVPGKKNQRCFKHVWFETFWNSTGTVTKKENGDCKILQELRGWQLTATRLTNHSKPQPSDDLPDLTRHRW